MTVADYQVLRDGNVELGEDIQQVIRIEFELPNDFVRGTNRAKPVLMYRVTPKDSATYVFAVNDPGVDDNIPEIHKQEVGVDIGTSTPRSMHEPVRGDLLNPGSTNWIDVRVFKGKAVFGDIVLLYQREV